VSCVVGGGACELCRGYSPMFRWQGMCLSCGPGVGQMRCVYMCVCVCGGGGMWCGCRCGCGCGCDCFSMGQKRLTCFGMLSLCLLIFTDEMTVSGQA
jgi:hypothetical protein